MRAVLVWLGVAAVAAFGCAASGNRTDAGRTPTTYATGSRPLGVAAGDLDGDGDLDLVTANSGSSDATVLLNDGHGAFTAAPGSGVGAGREPSALALVDVDRDGNLDVVFANHETSGVTVLLGDGRGGLAEAPGSPFDTGARPHVHGVAAGDFDGDGFVDLGVDSADDDMVHVLFGAEIGFAPAAAFPAGGLPYYRLGAADVAGDAAVELLVPAQRDRAISILAATGHGQLTRTASVASARAPWVVRAGDVDGDGVVDLAVVVEDGLSLLRGPSFQPFPGSPFAIADAGEVAVGDLDGDDVDEVAVGTWAGDEVVVLAGRTFAARSLSAGRRPQGLCIADLDGDGRGELVAVAELDDQLSILDI